MEWNFFSRQTTTQKLSLNRKLVIEYIRCEINAYSQAKLISVSFLKYLLDPDRKIVNIFGIFTCELIHQWIPSNSR